MVWSAVEHHDRERFELYFYSLSTVDDEWTARFRGIARRVRVARACFRARSGASASRRTISTSSSTCRRTRKARKPGILAREAGARADHARRELRHRGSLDDRFQADRSLRRRPGERRDANRGAAADGRMRVSVSPHRAGGRASIPPRNARHRRRRRSSSAPSSARSSSRAAAFRCGAKCSSAYRGEARVLAGQSRAARALSSAGRGGGHRGGSPALPSRRGATTARIRRATRSSISSSTRCPMAGSMACSRRSTRACPSSRSSGKRHGERTAYSILANLGVTATVRASGREYVEIAVRLATDPHSCARCASASVRASPARARPTAWRTRAHSSARTCGTRAAGAEALAAAGAPPMAEPRIARHALRPGGGAARRGDPRRGDADVARSSRCRARRAPTAVSRWFCARRHARACAKSLRRSRICERRSRSTRAMRAANTLGSCSSTVVTCRARSKRFPERGACGSGYARGWSNLANALRIAGRIDDAAAAAATRGRGQAGLRARLEEPRRAARRCGDLPGARDALRARSRSSPDPATMKALARSASVSPAILTGRRRTLRGRRVAAPDDADALLQLGARSPSATTSMLRAGLSRRGSRGGRKHLRARVRRGALAADGVCGAAAEPAAARASYDAGHCRARAGIPAQVRGRSAPT